jgi:hypothetical protein
VRCEHLAPFIKLGKHVLRTILVEGYSIVFVTHWAATQTSFVYCLLHWDYKIAKVRGLCLLVSIVVKEMMVGSLLYATSTGQPLAYMLLHKICLHSWQHDCFASSITAIEPSTHMPSLLFKVDLRLSSHLGTDAKSVVHVSTALKPRRHKLYG